ncbi:thioesterase [Devosia sp. Root436]|jgi:thioesterase domain-containing protein|uniref:YiiD C-terminal domain-containing protein n=1 Tax=Devosia sp. Root436 TaxID=1736537 RepID=UPI0006FA20F4|nr:YiiD C-terminal domain-containing protein [Devosia sp. Root436]KQX42878.1 thioesterase [Devosia sp. Root436]
MTEAELETYLHEHIPLSRAMDVRVISITDQRVTLGAPLAPNINHRDTVFGGSAASIATLAAWSLLHLRLTNAGLPSRVVIQSSIMDYLAPIAGDFTATATLDGDWDAFLRMLTRKGRGRIALKAALDYEGQKAGQFHGEFVAFGKDRL